jgi:hypothetical protein
MPQQPPDPQRPGPSTPEGDHRLTVSPIQVIASALASVSAAVVASLFNVAGTIVGTVLVSVVATLGAAIYSSSLRRAHARIRQVTTQRPPRSDPTHRYPPSRSYPPARGQRPESSALAGLANLGPQNGGTRLPRPAPQRRNWRNMRVPVLGATIAALVIAIVTLTIIELVAQKPLSAVVRGQSGSGQTFFGGGNSGGTKTPSTTTTTTTTSPSSASTTTPTTIKRPTTETSPSSSTTTTTVAPSATTTTSGAGSSASPTTTTTPK